MFSGRPNQNVYVERFYRTFHRERLASHIFEFLNQVRDVSAEWSKSIPRAASWYVGRRLPPVLLAHRIRVLPLFYDHPSMAHYALGGVMIQQQGGNGVRVECGRNSRRAGISINQIPVDQGLR